MSKKKKDKIPLYTKIVNEEGIANIPTFNKISASYMGILLFVGLIQGPCLVITFIGFSIKYEIQFIIFVILMIFVVLSFFTLIKEYEFMKRYRIFKKDIYFWLIHSISYIIGIATILIAYFTYDIYQEGDNIITNFNPIYYFVIIIPSIILYGLLLHYTYLICFQKYIKRYLKIQNREKGKDNSSKDSEESKTEIEEIEIIRKDLCMVGDLMIKD